jgi:LCP family protein required for cell wall assembly
MSLPRDLKVKIPGAGTGKINSAYEIGGPRKTVATIKRLFEEATGEEFPINNVINVNFGGFKRAVNYIGGVYVDIDRRYYNDNTTAAPGEAYAAIDVQPGYQRLKGQDALDYVRYRHGDNDFFRASRQQDFLRQVTHQDAVRALLDPGKRKELARVFGRYFEVDRSFVTAANLIGLAKTGLFLAGERAPVNEVRFPAYEAKDPAVDSYLYVKDSALRKTFREFMTGKGSSNPRRLTETTKVDDAPQKDKRTRNKPSAVKGLEEAPTEGENMAVLAESQGRLGFAFYFPALRKTGSRYADTKPRIYGIRDAQDKLHRAYRLVLYSGAYGEYYGVQGMSWRYPPILDDPDRTRDENGRKLMLYYDGSRLRLAAWRTSKAVYWVTNTLTMSIPNSRLIAIAGSLRRLKS